MDHSSPIQFLVRNLKTAGLALALMSGTILAAHADPNPSLISKNYFSPEGKEISEKLILSALTVEIDVRGAYAETRVTADFTNPTGDTLEGEFEFDMPEGSTLIGYGLDINGEMREGVIIEKKKAERTFNDRIRQGVDPGLAETTRDNAFTTRVFPILPGQTRTVSVSYVTPISDNAPYILPLESSLEPERVEFTITGDVSPGQVKLPGKFSPGWNEKGDTAHLLAENLPLDGVIEIRPETLPFLSVTRHKEGRSFAAFALDPADSKARFAPGSVRVYWDTSVSQSEYAGPALEFLSGVIEDVHPFSLQLVPFSDGLEPVRIIDLRPEGEELEHFTNDLTYHGATSLEVLYDAQAEAPLVEACFLVTDGRMTLGNYPTAKLPCKQLHTVSASPEADRGVMSLLAKQGGGHFINLKALTSDAARARLDIEVRAPDRLLIDGRDVLKQAEWIEDGSAFRLIVPVDPSARKYLLTVDGDTMEGSLPRASSGRHSGAGSSWAALRIVSERARGASRESLIELSRKFSVVSDETSLLVLESLWDYIQNDVELPDDGFTKQERAEYAEAIANRANERKELEDERLEKIETLWAMQTKWYSGVYEPTGEKIQEPLVMDSAEGYTGGSEAPAPMDQAPSMGGIPPAPPPPPATQSEPEIQSEVAQSRNDERQESVVVTGAMRRTSPAAEAESEEDIAAADDGEMVSIKAWTPERPYLEAVDGLCDDDLLNAYLAQRTEHGDLPSYFLEMADVFAACGDMKNAARVALSALELSTANDDTLTAVAMRLVRYGDPDKAIPLLRKVVRNDPTRPQPWRDLALALDRAADDTQLDRKERRARLEEALTLLNHVIETPWDDKYDGIEVVSVMEANRIAQRLKSAGGKGELPSDTLTSKMPVDLRIVVSWKVDETDMDLWVDEPTGERAMFSNPMTQIGGRLSNDMTEGYGPEEYLLKEAMPGTYEIYMDYYGSDIINPNGAVAIQAEIWRNWGGKNETHRIVDLEFTDDEEDEYLIATVVIGEQD